MMIRLLALVVFLLSCSSKGFCLIDLEDQTQDFILETRQIKVSGYPIAFNPSIVRWKGKLLMSFRVIPDRKQSFNSEIGVVWLNENFEAISEPQILDLSPASNVLGVPSRAEDGHLIAVGETLYLVYDDNRDPVITKGGFRVYIAKLEVVGERVTPYDIEPILYFEGESPLVREKSWVPFAFQDELLLAYSISPHRIFRYLPGTRSAEPFISTRHPFHWPWGIIRGGTPGMNIDDKYYLSFFHSCIKMTTVHAADTLHYFIGAYTYSLQPPFEILQMSQEPIIGKNFYHGKTYKPYWHPVCAVFPCGYICENDKITLFYGRQDHEIWIAILDKQGLLESLKF